LGHVEGIVPVEAVVALEAMKQNDGRHSFITIRFKARHVKCIADRLSPNGRSACFFDVDLDGPLNQVPCRTPDQEQKDWTQKPLSHDQKATTEKL
jgi:hypothetical protein